MLMTTPEGAARNVIMVATKHQLPAQALWFQRLHEMLPVSDIKIFKTYRAHEKSETKKISKMGRGLKWTFFKTKYTNGKQTP